MQHRRLGPLAANGLVTVMAALLMARNADSGYSTRLTPASESSSTVKYGVRPNSVRLASTGTSTAAVNAR